MAKNEAKIKFTAETGDLNKAIGKANNTLSEMRAELKLNETQMKTTGTSVEGLEKQHQLLVQQQEAAHDKTEALSQKLNKAVEIFGENSDEASRLRRQLANAATEEERIGQAIDRCNAELKEQQSVSKRTATATEQLTDEIAKQQTELQDLKDEYVDVILRYGENSNAAKDLERKIESLSGELNDNKKKLSEASSKADALEKSLDDAGDEAQDAGNQAESSSEGWTILKDVIADMASDAIQWAIESFKELMTAGDNALATLSARVGATSEEMSAYKNVMQDVYRNNYGESYDDIADAMSRVTQTLGDMDDSQLQSTTENAIALRDVFDMDYQEMLRAVNSLMDQFGLTSEESFSLIAQGAQNGLNQNDDLLDTINEYSVQFKNAGYSADDMFNMLNNGASTGTWSVDKLGDAVKEFTIRAKDGTVGDALKDYRKSLGLSEKDVKRLRKSVAAGGEEGREAYGEILTALGGVTDETTRYQAGVALFGTMWEDLGEETITALMSTQGELSKTKTAMEDVKDVKYDTLSSAWSELGRVLQTDLIQPIVDTLAPIAKDLVTWLIDNMDVIAPIIVGVATALGVLATALAIQGLIKGVSTAFAVLNAVMAANPIVLIIALIAGLVAAFIYLWNNCEPFRQFFVNMWESIKSAVASFGEKWDEFKTNLSESWENLKTAASEKWENIKNSVSEAAENAKTKASTAWENMKTDASTKWEETQSKAASTWEGIRSSISQKVNMAKSNASSAWNLMKSTASQKWEETKSKAAETWEGIRSNISQKVNMAKNNASSAWNLMKSTASTKWEELKTKASEVWENIKSAMLTPIENAKTAISAAIEKIKGFFDFEWSLPPIMLPHFSITGEFSLNPPSIPKISVSWYKEGGIMTAPTIFGAMGNKLLAGGEAGPEAILPIDKMEDYVASAVDKHMSVVNLEVLADRIEDLASRPINLNINGRQFALATVGDGDRVNGLRSTFKNRGLVLE